MSLLDFDFRFFKFLNSFVGKSEALDFLFVFFAEYVVFFLIAGLALFILLKKDRARALAALQGLTAAFLGRAVMVSFIRIFFFRPRPFATGAAELITQKVFEGSFPSGHATVMFAIAFSLFFADKRWGTAYLILALLSSLGRVIVGVHFPFDILGGILVGLLSALCAKWFFDFWLHKKSHLTPGA